MLDFQVILEIRKKAINSMQRDSEDQKISTWWKKMIFYSSFYVAPLLVCFIAWCRDIRLTSLENYIGSGIAIFTGLFFSLLLGIGAKIRDEKANPDKEEENFQKFKTSMKQIANITLFVIEIGIVIFVILLLNSILKSDKIEVVETIFTLVALFLLTQFLVSLFFMIQRFYFVVRDEINNIL